MGDIGFRNWRVDCPRLCKLCVQLETHFALPENRDRLLADLADARKQYTVAREQSTQRREVLREYCETTLAQNPQLCAEENQPDDSHRWHVHTCKWHVQKWCNAPDGAEQKTEGQPVEGVRLFISGWVPSELLDTTPGFVLPLPPEKADSIGRSLTQAERSIALAAVHDVVASSPFVAEDHSLAEWPTYWLVVENARNEADDTWAPKLEAWAKEWGMAEQPQDVMPAILNLLQTAVNSPPNRSGMPATKQKRTVNDRMRDQIDKDKASGKSTMDEEHCCQWSAETWAKRIDCAKSTVAETQAWSDLMEYRKSLKSDRVSQSFADLQ